MNKKKTSLSIIVSMLIASQVLAKDTTNLGEFVVSAQKVEQNVQDVPVSITVFDDLRIKDRNIKTIKDIAKYTPGLLLFDSGGFGGLAPTIRGVSTDPQSSSDSASIYIDGIPFSRTNLDNYTNLSGIERIEVLKGPQGTLYGKNAEAGVINIITRKPDNDFQASVGIEIGEDSKREFTSSISGPIIEDELFLGVNLRHYEKDGNIYNSNLKRRENDRKNDFIKTYLRWTPSNNLDIALISSYLKRDDGTISQNNLGVEDSRVTTSDIKGYIKNVTKMTALKFEYDIDRYKFESVSTYKKHIEDRLGDFDYSAGIPFTFHSDYYTPYTDLSQEFKLSYKDNKLIWLLGLFGEKNKKEGGYSLNSTIPNKTGDYLSTTKDTSLGAFGYVDYNITEDLSIFAGLRYDKITKKLDYNQIAQSQKEDFSALSPKLTLEYSLNKDIMTYATVSKGYKSGGYYLFAPVDKMSFEEESIWNYELGLKSSFLDNTLILNSAIYHMDISDMQVITAIDATQSYISNAAEATSRGIELEVNYLLNDKITLFSSLAYNKTKFDKFKDSNGDYEGNYNPNAPKYNYSLGATYRDNSGYYASADISGYGKMYLNRSNTLKKDSYALANLKLGYETENFDVYLYGNNIFDKEYDTEGIFDFYTAVSEPREFGIQIKYRF